ncbi:hypothetical protein HG531_002200 [Fusarium graminearum]|nr:hypothetical protein HG531_002200 [Fusarium graminearum]
MLTETTQRLREVAKKCPELKNSLNKENADDDEGNDDGDNQKNGHECVGLGNTVLLNIGRNTRNRQSLTLGSSRNRTICSVVHGSFNASDGKVGERFKGVEGALNLV